MMKGSVANFCFLLLGLLLAGMVPSPALAGEHPAQALAGLERALDASREAPSEARRRLAMQRVIREADKLLEARKDAPDRFVVLEFLFRARQQLLAIDKDPKHRQALLDTCRELVKAPDSHAEQRVEADLLLTQVELAKQGAGAGARAEALRAFAKRYLNTPAGTRALRMSIVMGLELGDERLVHDMQELTNLHFAHDVEMIRFQREKLAGTVFGAPFSGSFKRSDGRTVRLPMDMLGRSTILLFWSKEGDGMDFIKGLAADAKQMDDFVQKRIEILSFNLDGLPDAGESIIRGLGVDWQVLHLPGGRDNPAYAAFARSDPRWVTASPSGQVALVMEGTGRLRLRENGTIDHSRMLGSALAKRWSDPRYVMQLASVMSGDFLVLDPAGGIDPAMPPELKAASPSGAPKPLKRDSNCVPEQTLGEIQQAFVAAPRRYRLTHEEAVASYSKVIRLCRKAIAENPQAIDLWIVRNRLIIALMGLWKAEAKLEHLEQAIAEARTAVEVGYPEGCDLIARFCLARAALRDPMSDWQKVLDRFQQDCGGAKASGPALAVTALLSLDAADRRRFEDCRMAIIQDHAGQPMMWNFSAFLLDRYLSYYLFQAPFSAGRTYDRREGYFFSKAQPEDSGRALVAEFKTLNGDSVRLPGDLKSKWTVLVLAAPWEKDGPPSPLGEVSQQLRMAANRPDGDVEVMLVVFADDAAKVRELLGEKPPEVRVLLVPTGMNSPVVQRLGMLSEDKRLNLALLRRDGSVAATISGLAMNIKSVGGSLANTIAACDELEVSQALEQGDLDKARRIAFTFAPEFDPDALDDKGRKINPPRYSTEHLRARARVYMAMKQWDKALADGEEVVSRQLAIDGGLGMRTDDLDVAEALRDEIRGRMPAGDGDK